MPTVRVVGEPNKEWKIGTPKRAGDIQKWVKAVRKSGAIPLGAVLLKYEVSKTEIRFLFDRTGDPLVLNQICPCAEIPLPYMVVVDRTTDYLGAQK